MLPHLQRATQTRATLAALNSLGWSLLDAFELLPSGVLLLDSRGTILFSNKEARRILRQCDGIECRKGQLVGSCRLPTLSLDTGAQATNPVARANRSDWGGIILVPRPSGRAPYLVVVAPLRSESAVEAGDDPALPAIAVVFVHDAAEERTDEHELLRSEFGLTGAEAQVAMHIASGLRVQDIADLRSVKPNTIRSQLKSIFHKTHTHRQSQLGALIASLGSTGGERS